MDTANPLTPYRGYLYEILSDGFWYWCFVPITNHTGDRTDKGGAKRDAEIIINKYIDGE